MTTKYSTSNPLITTVLDISTAHILKKDSDLLDNYSFNNPIVAYRYKYGHFICINVELNREDLLEAGYSSYICDIISLALEKNCAFIKLDGDGTIYEELKYHEWED
jgi:hypothetical protein